MEGSFVVSHLPGKDYSGLQLWLWLGLQLQLGLGLFWGRPECFLSSWQFASKSILLFQRQAPDSLARLGLFFFVLLRSACSICLRLTTITASPKYLNLTPFCSAPSCLWGWRPSQRCELCALPRDGLVFRWTGEGHGPCCFRFSSYSSQSCCSLQKVNSPFSQFQNRICLYNDGDGTCRVGNDINQGVTTVTLLLGQESRFYGSDRSELLESVSRNQQSMRVRPRQCRQQLKRALKSESRKLMPVMIITPTMAHMFTTKPITSSSSIVRQKRVADSPRINPIARQKLRFSRRQFVMFLRLMQLLNSWLWWSSSAVHRLQLRQCSVLVPTRISQIEHHFSFSSPSSGPQLRTLGSTGSVQVRTRQSRTTTRHRTQTSAISTIMRVLFHLKIGSPTKPEQSPIRMTTLAAQKTCSDSS